MVNHIVHQKPQYSRSGEKSKVDRLISILQIGVIATIVTFKWLLVGVIVTRNLPRTRISGNLE